MKIIITESDLIRIVKKVLVEGSSIKLLGRTFIPNIDGSVTITNIKNKPVKIRFSKFYMDINISAIEPKSDGGCIVTAKSGTKKELTKSQVVEVIGFVDSSNTEATISGVDLEKI